LQVIPTGSMLRLNSSMNLHYLSVGLYFIALEEDIDGHDQ
jgi:hypothetical protein